MNDEDRKVFEAQNERGGQDRQKIGELWRTVTRLGEKYDRASATATKRLDCMQWILAVCKAPEWVSIWDLREMRHDHLTAPRKLEMIEQLLRRRAITEQSIGAPPASTPTDGSDAKPSPAKLVLLPPDQPSGLGNFEEDSE